MSYMVIVQTGLSMSYNNKIKYIDFVLPPVNRLLIDLWSSNFAETHLREKERTRKNSNDMQRQIFFVAVFTFVGN